MTKKHSKPSAKSKGLKRVKHAKDGALTKPRAEERALLLGHPMADVLAGAGVLLLANQAVKGFTADPMIRTGVAAVTTLGGAFLADMEGYSDLGAGVLGGGIVLGAAPYMPQLAELVGLPEAQPVAPAPVPCTTQPVGTTPGLPAGCTPAASQAPNAQDAAKAARITEARGKLTTLFTANPTIWQTPLAGETVVASRTSPVYAAGYNLGYAVGKVPSAAPTTPLTGDVGGPNGRYDVAASKIENQIGFWEGVLDASRGLANITATGNALPVAAPFERTATSMLPVNAHRRLGRPVSAFDSPYTPGPAPVQASSTPQSAFLAPVTPASTTRNLNGRILSL